LDSINNDDISNIICNNDVTDIIDEPDPITMRDIHSSVNRTKWLVSITDELNALIQNGVIVVCDKPTHKKLLPLKWVWKIKRDEMNRPIKLKSRIVVKGFKQKLYEDYWETFSPVVKFKTIKMLMALTPDYNFYVHQLDFSNAFLNATLEEEIYIPIPPELALAAKSINNAVTNIDAKTKCFKLAKALYGLKQAPFRWHQTLSNTLTELGYTVSQVDSCIYIKFVSGVNEPIIISCYVDDLLVFTTSRTINIWLTDKQYIKSKYKIDDIGVAKFILKMRLSSGNGYVKIDQQGYVINLLTSYNMINSNPSSNPGMVSINLSDPELFTDPNIALTPEAHNLYRSIIGSLLYLSNTTRIDIAFCVNLLARFVHKPTSKHLKAAMQVLRYLNGTQDLGLFYTNAVNDLTKAGDNISSGNVIQLTAYADSDWGGDKISRASTSGYVILCNGKPFHWSSNRQHCISQSTAEAEYIALNGCAREVVWCNKLLRELLPHSFHHVPLIYTDNEAAVHWTVNDDAYHHNTKHIDLKYKFVRQLYHDGIIDIKHVNTKSNVADILTKNTNTEQFTTLVSKLLSK
jgi:hypothetical protein